MVWGPLSTTSLLVGIGWGTLRNRSSSKACRPCPPVPVLQAHRYCDPHIAGRSKGRFIYSHPPLPCPSPLACWTPNNGPLKRPWKRKKWHSLTGSLPIGDTQYIALSSPSVDLSNDISRQIDLVMSHVQASRCGGMESSASCILLFEADAGGRPRLSSANRVDGCKDSRTS